MDYAEMQITAAYYSVRMGVTRRITMRVQTALLEDLSAACDACFIYLCTLQQAGFEPS